MISHPESELSPEDGTWMLPVIAAARSGPVSLTLSRSLTLTSGWRTIRQILLLNSIRPAAVF